MKGILSHCSADDQSRGSDFRDCVLEIRETYRPAHPHTQSISIVNGVDGRLLSRNARVDDGRAGYVIRVRIWRVTYGEP